MVTFKDWLIYINAAYSYHAATRFRDRACIYRYYVGNDSYFRNYMENYRATFWFDCGNWDGAYLMVIYHQNWLTSLGFKPYQFERITTWINPENDPQGGGYQVLRAMTAIGSGQISGNGVDMMPLQFQKITMTLFLRL